MRFLQCKSGRRTVWTRLSSAALAAGMSFATFTSPPAAAVTIDWVPVGDPGNAADSTGFGTVGYGYQISKYEVTNAQYAEFLNAKAASNTLGLFNTNMAGLLGGLTISGSPGSFTYGVKSGYANMPVKHVSWYNAIRFANWINNGQGNADTESGAYTLLGGTATPSNGNSITRNGGASVFLPSEDEWYKAAYHQPAAAGGDSDSYWRFPTRSNAQPDSDQPPGDPSIQGNVANFWRDDGLDNGYNDGYVVGTPTFVTDVGAYVNAPSYYGTFDQGGNVWEWNESLISETFRCLRGGSYASVAAVNPDLNDLRAELRLQLNPSFGGSDAGIRLASVPEPTSLAMLALAGVTVLRRRRRA